MKSSKLKLASIILAVVLCLLVLSAPAGAVVQPNSDFYVLDNENVLSAETEKYIIDRNLNLVSNCKGAQVCVVVTDSTNGQDIEDMQRSSSTLGASAARPRTTACWFCS